MQGKTISILVAAVIVLGIGGYVYSSRQAALAPAPEVNPLPNPDIGNMNPEGSPPTSNGAGPYTLADVAMHSSRSSCWAAINGSVYDLTSWIPNHPGGEAAILSICGKDGSAAFNAQHGGQGRPAAILAGFKIGTLAP